KSPPPSPATTAWSTKSSSRCPASRSPTSASPRTSPSSPPPAPRLAERLRAPRPAGRLEPMADTTCHMSISLDGFVAGPDQSRDNPLGVGGRDLHDWHLGDPRANDADAAAEKLLMRSRGAYIMGRNMYGPIRGDWDEEWTGWWGPEPPYHAPVFVLTNH